MASVKSAAVSRTAGKTPHRPLAGKIIPPRNQPPPSQEDLESELDDGNDSAADDAQQQQMDTVPRKAPRKQQPVQEKSLPPNKRRTKTAATTPKRQAGQQVAKRAAAASKKKTPAATGSASSTTTTKKVNGVEAVKRRKGRRDRSQMQMRHYQRSTKSFTPKTVISLLARDTAKRIKEEQKSSEVMRFESQSMEAIRDLFENELNHLFRGAGEILHANGNTTLMPKHIGQYLLAKGYSRNKLNDMEISMD